MDEKKARCSQRGPYITEVAAGTYYWCSCGLSAKQPFCDGSHQGSSFTPKKVVVEAQKKIAWCGCRRSASEHICDGSHGKLGEE